MSAFLCAIFRFQQPNFGDNNGHLFLVYQPNFDNGQSKATGNCSTTAINPWSRMSLETLHFQQKNVIFSVRFHLNQHILESFTLNFHHKIHFNTNEVFSSMFLTFEITTSNNTEISTTSKIHCFGLDSVFRPDWPADNLIFVVLQTLKHS